MQRPCGRKEPDEHEGLSKGIHAEGEVAGISGEAAGSTGARPLNLGKAHFYPESHRNKIKSSQKVGKTRLDSCGHNPGEATRPLIRGSLPQDPSTRLGEV